MKRRGFTFWQALALLVFVGVLAAILFPVFGRKRENSRKSFCQSSLKQTSLGIRQYMLDYDEKFPLVSVSGSGWADRLGPYVKSRGVFWCHLNDKEPKNSTDFFYNARLAGLTEKKAYANSPSNDESPIILLGDGNFGAGTNAHLTELPFEWLRDDESPARRHMGGANYAFIDGHVKWYKSERVGTAPPLKLSDAATFAIR